FASGVKRLFSLPSDFPQRLVSAQRRSVVAHYREFYGADNSFFRKTLSFAALHSKTPFYTHLHTNLSTVGYFGKICRASRKRLRYNLRSKNRHMIFSNCFEMLLQKPFFL
ncbi:hypothetical protein, partial [Xenorhabdus sp. PB62.4]|uniref:hypothetical protein n=1 Tax=Xenorhabdus sp. PB62.4 TaxID=1851573 RepID=UPI001CA390CE